VPEAHIPAVMRRIPTSSGPTPLAAVGAFETVVGAVGEYLRILQEQKTRRREIASEERVALARIAAQQELFMAYLDRSFDERAESFRRLFDVLDVSLRTGDASTASQTLAGIVDLARSGPFADLADLRTVQKRLNDPNHLWEV
jgi:hypothetical protein